MRRAHLQGRPAFSCRSLGNDVEGPDGEVREAEEDRHHDAEDRDVSEVALDVVVLGALVRGECGADRRLGTGSSSAPVGSATRFGRCGRCVAGADAGGAAAPGRCTRRCRALRLAALPARRAIDPSFRSLTWDVPRPGGRPRGGYDTADSMADLNRLLTDNLALAFGVLAAIVLVLLIVLLVQSVRLEPDDPVATASSCTTPAPAARSTTGWPEAPSRRFGRPSGWARSSRCSEGSRGAAGAASSTSASCGSTRSTTPGRTRASRSRCSTTHATGSSSAACTAAPTRASSPSR